MSKGVKRTLVRITGTKRRNGLPDLTGFLAIRYENAPTLQGLLRLSLEAFEIHYWSRYARIDNYEVEVVREGVGFDDFNV